MRALIIDDARAMRVLLRKIMEKFGFTVGEAASGGEGLAALAQNLAAGQTPPDVVLVDCHMPEMDGFTFVRTLRSEAALAGLPVLMVTADVEAGQPARMAEAGANGHLRKPFSPEALRTALEGLGLKVSA